MTRRIASLVFIGALTSALLLGGCGDSRSGEGSQRRNGHEGPGDQTLCETYCSHCDEGGDGFREACIYDCGYTPFTAEHVADYVACYTGIPCDLDPEEDFRRVLSCRRKIEPTADCQAFCDKDCKTFPDDLCAEECTIYYSPEIQSCLAGITATSCDGEFQDCIAL